MVYFIGTHKSIKKGFFKTVLFFEHLSLVVLIFSTVYFLIKLKLNYTYVYF